MRLKALPALVAFLTTISAATLAAGAARADLGPLEPIADAHRALHDSLGLPEPVIVRLLERGLPEPELPAVGLIAQRAHVPVMQVAELRLGGLPLVDVALRVGVGPEIFYVPYAVDPGPPYGKAWGYYKKTPRARWHTIRLADAAIVHSSNVLLVHRHYGVPVGRVVELSRGRSWTAVHHDLYVQKHGKGAAVAKSNSGKPAKAVKSSGASKAKNDKAKVAKSKPKPPKGNGKPQHR